jgi:hypothetical protein
MKLGRIANRPGGAGGPRSTRRWSQPARCAEVDGGARHFDRIIAGAVLLRAITAVLKAIAVDACGGPAIPIREPRP